MESDLRINKSKTGLVIIDLQKGIASADRKLAPHSADVVVKNAISLAEAFRKNSMPVFLVRVISSEKERLNVVADENPWASQANIQRSANWTDFAPGLEPKESDIVITKKQWGAFYGTDLELQLRRRGIDIIILCGIATNYGVESTARFAYEYGFNQIFAEDAITSMTKEMHDASINYVFKRIGRVRATEEILKSL